MNRINRLVNRSAQHRRERKLGQQTRSKPVPTPTPHEKTIRAMASLIRKEMPPLLPFRVYVRDRGAMPETDGSKANEGLCALNYKNGKPHSFSIFIARGTLREMTDTLIHEAAHMHAWFENAEDDHCAAWGVAKAQVYRLMQEFDA